MPELPEVEVVKLFLEAKLTGQTITNLEILNPKSFIGAPSNVIGQEIIQFSRIGKQLSIHLKNKLILLVHLKMTGQLIFLGKSDRDRTILGHPTPNLNHLSLPNKSTRLIFTFSSGDKLFFNDQRKFGWIRLLNQAKLVEAQKHLGFDIFSPRFTPNYLLAQLHHSTRPVKLVLLDQNKFAGIGNIYANDALFLAKINPLAPANSIRRPQAQELHRALVEIMRQSVQAGGSTAKDNKYVKPDGSFGKNQFLFRVYQRNGEPCLVCGTPVEKISIAGRGTFYCPLCQAK